MGEIRSHGYLLVGDAGKAKEKAIKMTNEIFGLDENKNSVSSHPDFWLIETDLFSIDNAREVRRKSYRRSFMGKGRVFVVEANFFSSEASNALLKTFEEPVGINYFFIITNSLENILETLRSRLIVLNFEKNSELTNGQSEVINKFLISNPDKRTELVKDIIEDKNKVSGFLDDLEVVLRERVGGNFSEEDVSSLSKLGNCRQLLFQRSSSPRMILDYLSCIIPSNIK
ncbi:MAG: hypothetical protein K9M15_02565 [Candidatus Marinimicrobia bacterium]|nr:hypothetical protein [Candidatus Neomarinimicrobiota bacterium]